MGLTWRSFVLNSTFIINLTLRILLRLVNSVSQSSLGKKSAQPFFRNLYKLGLKGMNYGQGSNFVTSGEKWVLDYLRDKISSRAIIIDVGANTGQYCIELIERFPEAGIYAFEPSKSTFEALGTNLTGKKAKLFNLALSDNSSVKELYTIDNQSGLASLHKRNFPEKDMAQEKVETLTLDSFCREEKIENIDFLKLDVEGHELSVLHGASELLSRGRIRFIQFEFGGCNIDSGTYFRDFYHLLSDSYKLYRILQDGLEPVNEYSENLEVFLPTNFLAELVNL